MKNFSSEIMVFGDAWLSCIMSLSSRGFGKCITFDPREDYMYPEEFGCEDAYIEAAKRKMTMEAIQSCGLLLMDDLRFVKWYDG